MYYYALSMNIKYKYHEIFKFVVPFTYNIISKTYVDSLHLSKTKFYIFNPRNILGY